MKKIFSISAGAALLLGASLAHAASPTAGSSRTQSNGTTPGAIGGTQQSLRPTGPAGTGGLNPTAPTVETSPGTVGGPSYNPSSEMPTESGSAGTAGTDTGTGG
jgi:hypothetical protein